MPFQPTELAPERCSGAPVPPYGSRRCSASFFFPACRSVTALGLLMGMALAASPLSSAAAETDALLATVSADMVDMPTGLYRMGNPSNDIGDGDERPAHAVDLKGFRIARHTVTFAQYDRYAAATGARRADDSGWGRGTLPVIDVSWDEAQAFIHWLNAQSGRHYRLPTEAEWEYAARAGSTTDYPWGDSYSPQQANGVGESGRDHYSHTAPVGQFPANAWGLYDMIGNVWQWVEDCYAEGYAASPTDGSAFRGPSCTEHVYRGGSWGMAPWFLRVTYRDSGAASKRFDALGFRLAQDP